MRKFLTGFLYITMWILSLPPLKILYFGAWIAYVFLHYIIAYRKEIITQNLRASFPGITEKELGELSKKYHRHLSRVLVESLKAMHWSVDHMKSRIVLSNPEHLEKILKSGKNIIVLAGHTGNWEWLPALIAPYGYDVLGVYKPQTNKVFNDLTFKMRKKEGVLPIAMRETARAIRSVEGNTNPKALLLIADQIPAKPDIHFWAKFMNQETAWFTGGEKIAQKYDLPVVFMKVLRTGSGRYEGTAITISTSPKREKEGDITRMYIEELEKNIKNQTENWLWSHRRWKHRPEDLSLQTWQK